MRAMPNRAPLCLGCCVRPALVVPSLLALMSLGWVQPVMAAGANLLVNGDFELAGVPAGDYRNFGPGNEVAAGLGGWRVLQGDVDIQNLSGTFIYINWGSAAGTNGASTLDLNGYVAGTIYQNFPTVAGQTYDLSFDYSNNPLTNYPNLTNQPVGTPASATVLLYDVASAGLVRERLDVSHGNATIDKPFWKSAMVSFVATGAQTQLLFRSTSNLKDASGGVILDNVSVSVSATPLPPTPVPTPGPAGANTPQCDVQLNASSLRDGDALRADSVRIGNPASRDFTVRAEFSYVVPGLAAPLVYLNLGADGSLVLPRGFDKQIGPVDLTTIQSSFPRGNYSFNCKLFNAITGDLLSVDLNSFVLR